MLFIEHGFHATGIAQIAKQSGVAVGQIYRDFAAKEDIVAAIVETDCGIFMARESLRDAIARDDAAAVRRWISQFVRPDDDDDGGDRLFAEIIAESARNDRIAAIFTSIQDDVHANMLAALEFLAPGDSRAAPREALAETILTLSIGLLNRRLMRPDLDVASLFRSLERIIDREIAGLKTCETA